MIHFNLESMIRNSSQTIYRAFKLGHMHRANLRQVKDFLINYGFQMISYDLKLFSMVSNANDFCCVRMISNALKRYHRSSFDFTWFQNIFKCLSMILNNIAFNLLLDAYQLQHQIIIELIILFFIILLMIEWNFMGVVCAGPNRLIFGF